MRAALRWMVVAVVLAHGLLHLLGAAKGLGWAEVARLQEPISTAMGVAWLAVAVFVVVAGVGLAVAVDRWWLLAGTAALVSQAMILTAFADAAAGTVANVLIGLAAVYGYASRGPRSLRAEYRRTVAAALVGPDRDGVVREADLVNLPPVVAAYVRRSGAVGRPRVSSFRARMRGRIRAGADRPWMTFVGEQVNTYGAQPTRLFFMDATMFGLPVDVLHAYVGSDASMRVKVCSLVSMVDVRGPQMTQAETVTLFNDLCVFAPAVLVDAPVTWQPLDDRRVRGTYTNGVHTVTAELVFNDDELVDFVSDDRLAASPDGESFTPRRWSTPLHAYGEREGRTVATRGEGRWHPDDAPAFAYIELELDDVTYNVGATPSPHGNGQDPTRIRGRGALPVLPFFVLTFGWTWSGWWLAASTGLSVTEGGPGSLLYLLGVFGPLVGAMWMVRRGGQAYRREFLRRVWDPRRISAHWWLALLAVVAGAR